VKAAIVKLKELFLMSVMNLLASVIAKKESRVDDVIDVNYRAT